MTVLLTAQELYAAVNTKARELDDHIESVVAFLHQNNVPHSVELRVKNWVRFQYPQMRADKQNREIMDMVPPALREVLACNMNHGLFSKVRLGLGAWGLGLAFRV